MARVIRISAALVAFSIGCALAVFPGPAIPFFFLAGALLATESKVLARFMDWVELRLRAIFDWGKKHWDRFPLWARVAVVMFMMGLSISGAVFSYRLWRD